MPEDARAADALADRLLHRLPADRRVLLAVDGIGASGKTTFASHLAARVTGRPVLLLHADDFFHPAPVRHARGRLSPEGFWLDAYDHVALAGGALEPLSRPGAATYRDHVYDRRTGEAVRPDVQTAPRDALVVVEGTFLHRDELAGYWDRSVYLHVPFAEGARRMAARDGADPDLRRGPLRRYLGAQRLYFAAARPWSRASLVVDHTDVRRPVVVDPAAVEVAVARELAALDAPAGR
ncbi:uridine kinase [Cellulomonas sp. ACRRI]|uniref:uridine kinase n=1 Tax=Cellulomonas sp. ACRRI TaxID=2918188 RepID=UPI001EF1C97F|nr:uridine kinase [Cellulomonas sp. ACRRI]MCG7286840.1 uridine kinase [Cellulomonas sp. ACRRI]